MKIFAMLTALAALFLGVSCERHQWDGKEGTSKLYPSHGEHGAHGEKHAEKGHDAKADEAGHEGHGH